jgi:ribonucleoside-diphosphate reductase alpha chain
MDYIFRWMGLQFLPGFREANSPNRGQQELAMPGLLEEIRKRVDRPVPGLLPLSDDTDVLVKADGTNGGGKSAAKPAEPAALTKTFVNQMDAPLCSVCGHVTVRNGACYKCLNCGESQGCS